MFWIISSATIPHQWFTIFSDIFSIAWMWVPIKFSFSEVFRFLCPLKKYSSGHLLINEVINYDQLTFIIWLGKGPSILSIIAKCSRLSWVFYWLTNTIFIYWKRASLNISKSSLKHGNPHIKFKNNCTNWPNVTSLIPTKFQNDFWCPEVSFARNRV